LRTDGSIASLNSDQQILLKETVGLPVILFDGNHIDPRGQTPGSRWESATDSEGGLVLAGQGSKKFKYTDQDKNELEYYRFSCGFRHHLADKIEFNWFLQSDSNKDQLASELTDGTPQDASEKAAATPVFQVVVDRSQATVIAAETESGSYELPTFDEASFGYHQIRIEAQPGYWRIAIGPEFSVNIPRLKDAQPGASVELLVTGNDAAHFEALRFQPFRTPPLSDGK